MSGNANSGRKSNPVTVASARRKLTLLTNVCIENIKRSVRNGNIEDSKWILSMVLPKANVSPEDSAGTLATLADVAKLALKRTEASGDSLRNITPDECNGVCDSQETVYIEPLGSYRDGSQGR